MTHLTSLGFIVFSAMTLIVFGDTAGKLLTAEGVSPFFVGWSRFALAAVLFLPFSGVKVEELKCFKDWRVLLRGALIAAGIASILTALKTEPIANVFGAFFVGPIVSYVLAVLFLGERPSGFQGGLLATGFLGVMLVVKPGFGASPGIAFALLAGCFYGGFLAMTKLVARDFRPRLLLFSQLTIGAVLLLPFGASTVPAEFTLSITTLVGISASASGFGNYLMVVANRSAPASLIAPLVYTQLIAATVLGVLVFSDWPDIYAFVGLLVILFSGVGSLWLALRKMRRSGTNLSG